MRKKIRGFTLIELVIVLAVLVLLITGVLLVLNPSKQLQKTYDVARLNDLNTITTSLDTYYHDTNCYPVSIPFGQQWSSGSTIYAQKLPNDPQESTNGSYVYFTDSTNSCPQWNVVFSKLSNQHDGSACKLPTNCYPQNYDNFWACQVSGTVDCNSLIVDSLPLNVPTSIASSTNTSNSTGNALSQKINICHANSDGTYNQIQVTEDATAGGHDGHAGDIIPSYSYSCNSGTCQYPGKNWDNTHQATYNNGCVVAATPTPTPTPSVCPYKVGSYCLDDTKLFQTYAVFFFPQPSFVNDWYFVAVSTDPTFPNDYTKTDEYFAPVSTPQFGSATSISNKAYLQFSQKLIGFQSLPNNWSFYRCGVTLYWKVFDFPDHLHESQVYSNVIDCNTKVGAFSTTGAAPLNWYIYYPYINGLTDAVSPGEPYNSTMDANGDGKIDWVDYIILSMNTKMRAGGWEPPE